MACISGGTHPRVCHHSSHTVKFTVIVELRSLCGTTPWSLSSPVLCYMFQSLDEATSLLSATCDTFIQTLEDCMKIVHTVNVYETHHITDSPIPPSPTGLTKRVRLVAYLQVALFETGSAFPLSLSEWFLYRMSDAI